MSINRCRALSNRFKTITADPRKSGKTLMIHVRIFCTIKKKLLINNTEKMASFEMKEQLEEVVE